MEKKAIDPLYYDNLEDMRKPLSKLMEDLRTDISKVRGKLHDIKIIYGWDDRIEHLEGGLTCMLIAMYATTQEWEKFEDRQKNTHKDI